MLYQRVTPKLGIVSTYSPRRCGLATYTADLRCALTVATDDPDPAVVAIDRDGLSYGEEVVAVVRQDNLCDYRAAADALAAAGVNVVLIQHEYGIFGGSYGSHVLALTEGLAAHGIPYVVTLHTVLSRPTAGQAAALRMLCARAAKVTVFTETVRRMLVRAGTATDHQIVVVPHGAPIALRTAPERGSLRPEVAGLLDRLAGKPTLTTFGLISSGKGIHVAIKALADVVRHHPDTHYVVAGATHPEVVRHAGETYREGLHALVDRLGLSDRVHFVDLFLTEEELSALLHSTTLFVTPYRSAEQICSGALTFALAAGCPVVSTAYRYAQDMLQAGGGRLVPCGEVGPLAAAIVDLLGDPAACARERAVAETIGAAFTWPAVAVRAAALFGEVAQRATDERHSLSLPQLTTPPLRLDHLDRLTDDFGIIQFANGVEPDPESGYCVDDAARLAIVAAEVLATGRGGDLPARWLRLAMRFLDAAYDCTPGAGPGEAGRMHNLLSYKGSWADEPGTGDHVGRTIWALGVVVSSETCPDEVRLAAAQLLDRLAPTAGRLAVDGLRSAAYSLIGLTRARRPAAEIAPLVHQLQSALKAASRPGWRWFEPELTYDNARLPQALLAGAVQLGESRLAARALTALDWYLEHVGLESGMLRCVGNLWHRWGEANAWGEDGDEQPLDAAACVEALVAAWQHTGSIRYARAAGWAYEWFLGRNRVGARLYAETTGGCHDGLSATGANANQGAESTLAYYQALLSLVRTGLAALPDRVAVVERLRPATTVAKRTVGHDRVTSKGGRAAATAVGTASERVPTTGLAQPTTAPRRGPRARTTEGPATDAR
jgi:glycosyltransferase involved in cell wall biosynthesis